jgi:dihydroorotase
MTMETVIEGNAFILGEIVKCCIGIEDGKIKEIKKILKGDEHFDFGDKLILPAGIDSHVHFRDPGFTHKEDFESGSCAAAYGGITCVLDMPNTIPPVTTNEALLDKIRIAQGKSIVDFGIYAGVSENSDIPSMAVFAPAFKLYLASTTGKMKIENYNSLSTILETVKSTGKVLSIHCEDERLLEGKIKTHDLKEHLMARPNQAEASAIDMVLKNSNEAKIHICHISTVEGAKLVSSSPSTSEVTPHHLFFNIGSDLGSRGKVNPPLRRTEDQEALWNGLRSGDIDIMASDHAPHTLEEKEEFQFAPSGMPGVETMFPLMLWRIKHHKFELPRLISAMCEKPGEIFGINKGKLEVGYDADIIMVDMREETEIDENDLHSKCGWSAYHGLEAVFPKFTFLRGEIVVEDWEMTGEKGWGRMIDSQE